MRIYSQIVIFWVQNLEATHFIKLKRILNLTKYLYTELEGRDEDTDISKLYLISKTYYPMFRTPGCILNLKLISLCLDLQVVSYI